MQRMLLVLLNHRALIDDEDLMNKCWECIDREFEEFAKTEDFKDIDYNYLDDILSRDSLQAKEVSIFNGVLEWAKTACTRKNLPITGENQRTVLGDVFYKIRFPTMTQEEFAQIQRRSLIFLVLKKNLACFYILVEKSKTCHSFPSQRQPSFCKIYNCIDCIDCDDDDDDIYGAFYFTVDKDITVRGFGLYGSRGEACEYRCSHENSSDDFSSCLGRHNTTNSFRRIVPGQPRVL